MGYRVLIGRLAVPVFAGMSLVATTTVVSAEPVTVTSGYFFVAWDDPTDFEFAGTDGFALNSTGVFVPISPQETCFRGCTPGTSLNFGTTAGGESPSIPFTLGQMFGVSRVNGVTFSHPGGVDAPQLAGTFHFDAPTIVLPPIDNSPDPARFSAPFTFSGTASAFARDDINKTSPLFSVTLAGRGTARVVLDSTGGSYHSPEAIYTFEDSAAVPEPASLTLLASGLIGVAARACRKRRAGMSEPTTLI